jgi:hypothetical protein
LLLAREKTLGILAAGAAAMASFAGALALQPVQARASTNTAPVAFTAEFVIKDYDAANRELRSVQEVIAQRGDGSIVRLRKRIDNREAGTKRMYDTSKRQSISVDPLTQSLLTYDLSPQEIEYLSAPGSDCRKRNPYLEPVNEPPAKVLGFEVVHLRGKPPGAEFHLDRWSAPALNCFIIREELASSEHRQVRSTVSVELGEPEPSLFDVPANFVERSPSEIMALAAAQRDGRVDPRTASQLDSIYWNRKAQK